MVFAQPIFKRLRMLCLQLPEVEEVTAWNHPNFRVRKRAFVAFEHVEERPTVAFRLDRARVDALIDAGAFFATPYGKGLWASAWADRKVSTRQLERLAVQAYRELAGVRLVALLDARATRRQCDPRRATRSATRRTRSTA